MNRTRSIPLLLITMLVMLIATPSATGAPSPALEQRNTDLAPSTPTPDQVQPQVVGGTPAAPGAWPWMVSLSDTSAPDDYAGHFCGGALIAPQWVLTAAHCHDGDPSKLAVVLGKVDLTTTGGERIAVSEIVSHPGYPLPHLDADIALLKLAEPSQQPPIKLASPEDLARFAPGTQAIGLGWGALSAFGTEAFPTILQQVPLPIISNQLCNDSVNGGITPNQICAGERVGVRDTCGGDSGGPLVVSDGRGGWLHTGVVSWGIDCALPNFYGVYTRTAPFKGWVEAQIAAQPHVAIIASPPYDRELFREEFRLLSTAAPGEPVTYTLEVYNAGAAPLHDLVITNTLPLDATYLASSDDGILDGNDLRWVVPGPLAPGEAVVRTFTVSAATTITNGDYGVIAESSAGAVRGLGRIHHPTFINQPVLDVAASGSEIKQVGVPHVYTLRVRNLGRGTNAAATRLLLSNTLPANTNYVSGGDLAGNVVSWQINQLGPGEETTRILVVQPTAPGPLINADYRVTADNGVQAVGLWSAAAIDKVVQDKPPLNAKPEAGQRLYVPFVQG
jgi:uncharacterized repeat protein (TIGR01451 family)